MSIAYQYKHRFADYDVGWDEALKDVREYLLGKSELVRDRILHRYSRYRENRFDRYKFGYLCCIGKYLDRNLFPRSVRGLQRMLTEGIWRDI